jgi:hypothetical protein
MNKQQAQQIIRDTFESSFNKSRFTGFIKNLLNRIDDAPFTYQGNYIPDAYKQYIKILERIGKFSDGENSVDKDRKISFVDALSRVLISGELKNMPALSFDEDFKALGLTTIS